MTDIATAWDIANNRGDWSLAGSQLQSGNDLQTAVLISLFTDRVAKPDDVIPDGSSDPRGWWGDGADAQYPIGSRLWLISRAKQTPEVLGLARDIITEALQWLLDDGVAARVDVAAEFTRPGMLGIGVQIYKQDGSREALNFSYVWNQ